VFHPPKEMRRRCGVGGAYVKRIVGIPGDTVEGRAGRIYVNGDLIDDSFVGGPPFEKRAVHHDQFFVVGDNRTDSCDSRQTQTIPRSSLIGPVIATYWPAARVGGP
jgi:signal peptidase I